MDGHHPVGPRLEHRAGRAGPGELGSSTRRRRPATPARAPGRHGDQVGQAAGRVGRRVGPEQQGPLGVDRVDRVEVEAAPVGGRRGHRHGPAAGQGRPPWRRSGRTRPGTAPCPGRGRAGAGSGRSRPPTPWCRRRRRPPRGRSAPRSAARSQSAAARRRPGRPGRGRVAPLGARHGQGPQDRGRRRIARGARSSSPPPHREGPRPGPQPGQPLVGIGRRARSRRRGASRQATELGEAGPPGVVEDDLERCRLVAGLAHRRPRPRGGRRPARRRGPRG